MMVPDTAGRRLSALLATLEAHMPKKAEVTIKMSKIEAGLVAILLERLTEVYANAGCEDVPTEELRALFGTPAWFEFLRNFWAKVDPEACDDSGPSGSLLARHFAKKFGDSVGLEVND
jgi:hypothetical protein